MAMEATCQECKMYTEDNLLSEIADRELEIARLKGALEIAEKSVMEIQEQGHHHRIRANTLETALKDIAELTETYRLA